MSLNSLRRTELNTERHVLKGLVAGTVGGLVASWVMEEFQTAWTKAAEGQHSQRNGREDEQQEPATVKAAEMISAKLLGRQLAKEKKDIAGAAVHYATGGASGAIYGAVAELAPHLAAGAGIPFGTAVWLLVDETAVPLLGLSKGPTEYPLSTHVYALTSHFVYGVTTELVRRVVLKAL